MEKFVYLFLPMALLFKLFINKKESNLDLVIKYFSLCFINNLICALFIFAYYRKIKVFDVTIAFFIKYSLLSLGVGIVMAIIYNLFKNFIKVKFEVVNEKRK